MTDTMTLYDTVSVDDASVRRTTDGYLVADARVARSGIQTYTGAEMGMPERDTVRVYRPQDEVFAQDAMHSYAHRPMTNNHPREPVNAENWRDISIGQTGGEVARDGEFVRVPLVMMDAQAIADYEAGKRELSMGYDAEIVFQDGETESGEKYDAVQKSLRMNHVALVDRARGGSELRIGDDRAPGEPDQAELHLDKGGHHMADTTRKVVVDGLTIETTEQGAEAISKLHKQATDAETAKAEADQAHEQAIATKDAELATKDAKIEELEQNQLSDADLDAKVAARAELIGKAKAISDQDYSGKSEGEIRKAAVAARFGDEAVKGKSDAYIEARFDLLDEQTGPDPVRAAMNPADRQPQDNGQSDYEQRITDAWKGTQKEAS